MLSRPTRTSLTSHVGEDTPQVGKDPSEGSKFRSFDVGHAVQVRHYSVRPEKGGSGAIKKEGLLHDILQMNGGAICRRNTDQLLPTQLRGRVEVCLWEYNGNL